MRILRAEQQALREEQLRAREDPRQSQEEIARVKPGLSARVVLCLFGVGSVFPELGYVGPARLCRVMHETWCYMIGTGFRRRRFVRSAVSAPVSFMWTPVSGVGRF